MVRFRTRNYLRPVNSLKHVIDVQGGLVAGTKQEVVLADTVDNALNTNADNVQTSSVIKSIFLNIQVAASGSGALANVYMYVYKTPSNALNFVAALPDGNTVGTSDVRKLIFHQEMIMTEKNTTAIARTLFKGVLKIPRHMQRMGIDDRLSIAMFSPGVTFDFCIQCIYKELR